MINARSIDGEETKGKKKVQFITLGDMERS